MSKITKNQPFNLLFLLLCLIYLAVGDRMIILCLKQTHKAINNARSPISNTQSLFKPDITPFQKHVCIDTAR